MASLTLVAAGLVIAHFGDRGPPPAKAGADAAIASAAPPAKTAAAAGRRPATAYTVCLQPLGEYDNTLLDPIGRGVAQAYGFSVRQLGPRPLPQAAWYPPRSRYRAQLILDHLVAEVLPADAGCDAVMAFTSVDVSASKGDHPDWGVLGLAYLGGRVGVVSSFRMRRDADRRRLVERAVKVVVHELGHSVGVPHRDDGPTCIMNDAGGSVRSIDRAHGTLCAPERAVAEAKLDLDLPEREQLDWDAILRG